MADLLGNVREKPERLLSKADPGRAPRAFRLVLPAELGSERGKAEGSFVSVSRAQTLGSIAMSCRRCGHGRQVLRNCQPKQYRNQSQT